MEPINFHTLQGQCTRHNQCAQCFYCEEIVPTTRKWHEHDHFPIPRRAQGNLAVTACLRCHNLKDRTPVNDWDLTQYFTATKQLFESLDVQIEQATTHTIENICANLPPWNTIWGKIDWPTRILYAKYSAMHADRTEA